MKVGVAVGFQVEGVVVVDVVVVVVVVSVATLIVGMLVGLAVTIDAVGFGVTTCKPGLSLLSISFIETSTLLPAIFCAIALMAASILDPTF